MGLRDGRIVKIYGGAAVRLLQSTWSGNTVDVESVEGAPIVIKTLQLHFTSTTLDECGSDHWMCRWIPILIIGDLPLTNVRQEVNGDLAAIAWIYALMERLGMSVLLLAGFPTSVITAMVAHLAVRVRCRRVSRKCSRKNR